MRTFAVTLLAGASLAATAAQARHVDFYEQGDFALSAEGGETVTDQQSVDPGAGGALGGVRDVSLFGGDTGASADLAANDVDDVDDGVIFASGPNATLTFTYGGEGNSLDADFINIPDTDMDWDSIELVLGEGTGSGLATVTLGSGINNMMEQFASGSIDFDGNGSVFIDYSAFSGVNLEDVDFAELEISGLGEQPLVLNFFARAIAPDDVDVPAPAALGLLGLGLAGLAGMRRRRKSA